MVASPKCDPRLGCEPGSLAERPGNLVRPIIGQRCPARDAPSLRGCDKVHDAQGLGRLAGSHPVPAPINRPQQRADTHSPAHLGRDEVEVHDRFGTAIPSHPAVARVRRTYDPLDATGTTNRAGSKGDGVQPGPNSRWRGSGGHDVTPCPMNGHALYADSQATVHRNYQSSGDKSMLNHRPRGTLTPCQSAGWDGRRARC